MIARLGIALPFYMAIPKVEDFPIIELQIGKYGVRYFPPQRSGLPQFAEIPSKVTLDGIDAFMADALRIDFVCDSFDRTMEAAEPDPTEEVIYIALEFYLCRLRYITRDPNIRTPYRDVEKWQWHIRYLNDDGTELEQAEGYRRGIRAKLMEWRLTAVNQQTARHIMSMPIEWSPPPWDDIILDARKALPHIGTAVVLAATSLEVLIAAVLDNLAGRSGIAPELWEWMRDRDNKIDLQPSVEEQFDVLLKYFCGHSLKENMELWNAFKNLKTARNKFVHEGIAKVGGMRVSSTDAAGYVTSAEKIIKQIREWLPEELRWNQFETQINFHWEHELFRVQVPGEGQATPPKQPTVEASQ